LVGPLSNGGDTITVNRPGKPEVSPPLVPYIAVETIKYNDSYPWPGAADGDGPALSKLPASLGLYGNDPIHWGVSGGPTVTVDPLTTTDQTPQLTGTVTDVHQPTTVTVTVDGTDYAAPVVGGVWTLSDNTIAPPLGGGVYDVVVSAVDIAGNVGVDNTAGELNIDLPQGVVGRHVFYNNSAWDVGDDNAAVDPSKSPLLPGGVAESANSTSYSLGINGIMVDIDGLTGTPAAGDFVFNINQAASPNSWSLAPAPESVTVHAGEGVGGSDRITIIWTDGAIANQWIEVTVLATANTGLAAADVFYFGNATGDIDGDGQIGDSDYNTLVSQFGQRGAMGALAADLDADGRVGLRDFTAVRKRFGESVLAPTVAPAPLPASAPAAPQVDSTVESPLAAQPTIADETDSDLPVLASSELLVDAFGELPSPGVYVASPIATDAGLPEAPLPLAATTESDLQPLSDDLLSGSAGDRSDDGVYLSVIGDDPLTDLLSEAAISIPL
jgi:hypothetical protein